MFDAFRQLCYSGTEMKPTIVFLDEATVNIGDLDIKPISQLGKYRRYNVLHRSSQILLRAKRGDIIITNKEEIGEKEFSKLPRLKLICVTATGVNNIDLKAAKRRGIAITNVAGYSTPTVAEHALMFILALGHRLLEHHESAVSGEWSRSPFYNILDYAFQDLAGKRLGIIGYGAIGKRVARLAKGLGMTILIAKLPRRKYGGKPRRLSLPSLLRQSDFVCIHTALSDQTRHLIDKKNLRLMKRSAYLINVARGAVVHERDLAYALKKGQLAGYATDVLSEEPPPRNHPLLQKSVRKKVLLSPHVAWASRESRQRVIDEVGKNIEAFLKGRHRNRLV